MQHMPRTIILIWGVTAKVETIAFANEGMNLALDFSSFYSFLRGERDRDAALR